MGCVGVQLSFCCIVYPSVLITYLGQSAFLIQNPDSFADTFYDAIPEPVYWPMFVISILAAIVASQVGAPQCSPWKVMHADTFSDKV